MRKCGECEKNYLAGIWDADGSFGVSKRTRGGYQPFAIITMCDPKSEIIGAMIEKNFGFKNVWSSNRRNPKWNIAYRWLLSSRKACEFAGMLEPYLIVKKERAQILMDWPIMDRRAPFVKMGIEREIQDKLYIRIKKLNKRGT
jgi:hypothetical protein